MACSSFRLLLSRHKELLDRAHHDLVLLLLRYGLQRTTPTQTLCRSFCLSCGGNTLVLWLSFVLEAFVRYVGMLMDKEIRVNPDSYWKTFKECMPHLLNYLCGASFAVTSAAVTLNGDSVPAETELVASVVLAVFYMIMAFGLMVLKRGCVVGYLVCVSLYVGIHNVYPHMSADLGPHLKNWGEMGHWELPAQTKKPREVEPIQSLPSFVGWIFNPVANRYKLLLLERVQILLILFVSFAALVILIAEHRVSTSMAGRVFNGIGIFLEWVNLKHVCYEEYA